MKPVAVIGAGLTGLVAAERLAAASLPAVVYEREDRPGGACRSIEKNGYVFDYTGHLLHVGRPETESYLKAIGVWPQLEVHERRAAVVIGGHTTPYPVQIHTHGLAPEVRRDCLMGFIRAWAGPEVGGEADFRQWVLARFGEGLARHFFFPYNSKLYRARPEELSLDWVGRYVPKPGLEEVVDGALGLHRDEVGYNAVFRYPAAGGIELLPEAISRSVPGLRLGAEVQRLHLGERWLELADGERSSFDQVVFTGSLPALMELIEDPLPDEILSARAALRWVRVVNLALGVEAAAPVEEHWLYFPDAEIPFYRVGFPSNHGELAPPGCHTVSLELSLDPDGGDIEGLVETSEHALAEVGLLNRDAIAVRQVTVIDPAYVVFDHQRKAAVSALRAFLRPRGVRLSGRWAEWKYSAMEDAVLDGMAVARRLGAGRASS